ncbi:MAG TPA: hypothetical protein DCW83_02265 [Saprospirales bacterium]|jgi:hypothetical protein|nr:hypothetical protein [Saprospirales bacterium]
MKIINDKKNPSLLGVLEPADRIDEYEKWVDNLNQDLKDSGYDQYEYKVVKKRDKLYINRL